MHDAFGKELEPALSFVPGSEMPATAVPRMLEIAP